METLVAENSDKEDAYENKVRFNYKSLPDSFLMNNIFACDLSFYCLSFVKHYDIHWPLTSLNQFRRSDQNRQQKWDIIYYQRKIII